MHYRFGDVVFATLEQLLVLKKLGRLSARDQHNLRETIATLFE